MKKRTRFIYKIQNYICKKIFGGHKFIETGERTGKCKRCGMRVCYGHPGPEIFIPNDQRDIKGDNTKLDRIIDIGVDDLIKSYRNGKK